MPRHVDAVVRAEWSWEGNVQAAIARFLVSEGWQEPRCADTESQERGYDLETWRDGRRLIGEVKGFPATVYASGPNVGKPKPTSPSLQARMWFSHALLSALTMRSEFPGDDVVIGLPDVDRYRSLLKQTAYALRRLDIAVILVAQPTRASWYCAPGKSDA